MNNSSCPSKQAQQKSRIFVMSVMLCSQYRVSLYAAKRFTRQTVLGLVAVVTASASRLGTVRRAVIIFTVTLPETVTYLFTGKLHKVSNKHSLMHGLTNIMHEHRLFLNQGSLRCPWGRQLTPK